MLNLLITNNIFIKKFGEFEKSFFDKMNILLHVNSYYAFNGALRHVGDLPTIDMLHFSNTMQGNISVFRVIRKCYTSPTTILKSSISM